MKYHEGIIKNGEFFTTAELAEKLKMNVQVITRKIQSGEIRAYKLGKDWRIPEESVHNWLEGLANDSQKSSKEKVVASFVKDEHIEKMPVQRSKRKFLLEYVRAQFEPNKSYTRIEVDKIIARYHDDSETVRGEFVTEGMMESVRGSFRRRPGYRFSD